MVMTPGDLMLWARGAGPGTRIIYHEGFLLEDREGDNRLAANRIANTAYALYLQGLVELVQTRKGPGLFAYQAVRRKAEPSKAFFGLFNRMVEV
jgi:hypothetical protein